MFLLGVCGFDGCHRVRSIVWGILLGLLVGCVFWAGLVGSWYLAVRFGWGFRYCIRIPTLVLSTSLTCQEPGVVFGVRG